MARHKKKAINFRKYKTKREMNIGILIFAIVFIYLIITILTYATSKRISVYEVRKGSIVKDNSYTGLILREETVVNAERNGYISYFQNKNTKVRAGRNICAISAKKLDNLESAEAAEVTLSDESSKNLNLRIQSFNENFSSQKFSSVYSLKTEYNTALQNASNHSRTAQLDTVIAESGGDISVYQSLRDGVMVLTLDGYEGVKEADLKASDFDRSNYEAVRLDDQTEVKAGSPAYKLVTSENWAVYVPLDKETAKDLESDDTTVVKARIDKDNETMWADFSILQKNGEYYGRLEFDNSMIRYCEDRYLTVELILEDQSGLKIPKSAVTEKSFYVVPEDYLTSSGSSSSKGVMVKDGNDVQYQSVNVYYTTEDGMVYLNPNEFRHADVLVKPESTETYALEKESTLKGVYCINQGYAVFRRVDILCENDDYYIIQEGTSYGLANYDHIVQDGKTVSEDEVVFQ